MILIIAEKPSVGKTIASVVGANIRQDGYIEGNGYVVSWCYGHLITLEEPGYYSSNDDNYWNIDDLPIIPIDWCFKLSDDSGARKQFKILKNLMFRSDVDSLICATDAGREGECIFRYVYNFAKCSKPVKRLWTSSLEEFAINDGLNNLKDDSDYDNLYYSGLSRAKADWLIGMNLTRGYSIKYNSFKPVLSIGRVQTPTLAMIVDRYNQFNNFVVEKYFKIDLDTDKGFTISSIDKYNKKEAEIEFEKIGNNGVVSNYEEKRQSKAAPKLFDLTLLQRTANKMYGYTAKETLDIAQKLYENKIITYPRTDSNYVTDDMENTLTMLVNKLVSMNKYSSVKESDLFNDISKINISKVINNKKVSDHHALLPTMSLTEDRFSVLSTKEQNILNLICSRLLVAVSSNREYTSVKTTIIVNDKQYEAKGIKIINNGYKDVEKALGLIKKEEKENNIPKLDIGEHIIISKKSLSEHQTQPPQLYTDDTLLKAMEIAGNDEYEENSDVEKKGIGTPATRAGILETLISRDYIKREKKKLIPTKRGLNLIDIVPDYIKSAKVTADWESYLQFIEKGRYDRNRFMDDIEFLTKKMVNEIKERIVEISNEDFKKEIPVIGRCPFCDSDYLEYKKIFKCSNKDCGSVIFRSMASKNITKTIAKKLLKEGRVENVEGFISKSGKEFSTSLTFDENRKCVFDF